MSRLLNGSRGLVRKSITRNFGVTAVALKELDPIQALFIEKIKEYTKASEEAGDDLLGASDEIRAKLVSEYEKIGRMYGAESGGMDEFPTFTLLVDYADTAHDETGKSTFGLETPT